MVEGVSYRNRNDSQTAPQSPCQNELPLTKQEPGVLCTACRQFNTVLSGSPVLLTILKTPLLASAAFRWQVLSQYLCSFVCLSFFITALITYSEKVWYSKSSQFHWIPKAILSSLDSLVKELHCRICFNLKETVTGQGIIYELLLNKDLIL